MKERLDQLLRDPIWRTNHWCSRSLRELVQEVDGWADDYLSRALDIFEALAFTLTNMVEAPASSGAPMISYRGEAERTRAMGTLMASYMDLRIERTWTLPPILSPFK